MKKHVLLIAAIASLTACVSGRPPQDTYTSPTTGTTTVIQSDHEMCESSCNSSNSRCMDTQAASQSTSDTGLSYNSSASGMFGASAECRNELSSCLDGCKGR